MKKLLLSVAVLSLLSGNAGAGIVLSTSAPSGAPLNMSSGTTSGPMFANVISLSTPNDVMSGWNLTLAIVPDAGASGTLTFQDPPSGPPMPGYIFGADGLGVATTYGGTTLSANDFLDPSISMGVTVPGISGASLLQMNFLASSYASGSFGVYALEGMALTEWTDGSGNAQLFTNVPDGSGIVRIGNLIVLQSVPEPSSLVLLGLGSAALAAWQWRRKRKRAASSS